MSVCHAAQLGFTVRGSFGAAFAQSLWLFVTSFFLLSDYLICSGLEVLLLTIGSTICPLRCHAAARGYTDKQRDNVRIFFIIYCVSGQKVNQCIHFSIFGKQRRILTEFCTNNMTSNRKQSTKFH